MKIWRVEGDGSYCGGVAIVAAPTVEAAINVASTIRNPTFRVDYSEGRATALPELSGKGPARVITHYEMGE